MSADAKPSYPPYGQPPGSANDPFSIGLAYDPPLGDSPDPRPRDLDSPLWAPPVKEGQGKRSQARVTDVTIAVILPWLVFFLSLSLFLFVYHEMRMLAWLVIALCVGLSCLFLAIGASARHPAFVAIGFLCFTSVVMGTAVGVWLHAEYMVRWYELSEGVEYWGVHPTAAATKTSNAAAIHFTPGTFVNDRQTLGFVTGGGIFCLAPLAAPLAPQAEVQYWASGEDCCEQRSNFDCGTSRDPGPLVAVTARSASASSAEATTLARALAEAASVYGLKSAASAQVMRLVADPRAVRGDLWDEALTIALIAMIMDLCLCVVAGLVVAQLLHIHAGKMDRGL